MWYAMHSGKQGTSMAQKRLAVIANAIQTAFIDHPSSGPGTTWEQVVKSDEESLHLARAVLFGLKKAGYIVAKIEDDENA
jgi:hypothetical protein